MKLLEPVIALLQFTTILPLGKTASFDAFARNTWLYPLAGYVTGGLTALLLYLLPAPPLVLAAAGIAVIFILTGCNHLDGLLDLGDGLMAHGGRDVRIRALTDRTIGTGGIACGSLVILLTFGSLASCPVPWIAVIVAEVLSRYAMALMTIFGRPFHDGLHATLHSKAKTWFIIPGALLILPLGFLPVDSAVIGLSLFVVLAVTGSLFGIATRLFGGVNGDVCGSLGEISRALVLAVFACFTAGAGGLPLLL